MANCKIKKNVFWPKNDPAIRVEIQIDQDVFDEGLAFGREAKERKMQDCLSSRLQ